MVNQAELKGRSLLLISPLTYNYHEFILDSAARLGLKTVWLNERPSNFLLVKIISRYLNRFSRYLSFAFYNKLFKSRAFHRLLLSY